MRICFLTHESKKRKMIVIFSSTEHCPMFHNDDEIRMVDAAYSSILLLRMLSVFVQFSLQNYLQLFLTDSNLAVTSVFKADYLDKIIS